MQGVCCAGTGESSFLLWGPFLTNTIEIPYIYIVVVRAYYFIYSFYINTKLTVCTKPVAVNDDG